MKTVIYWDFMEFVKVCKKSDIKLGTMNKFEINGKEIVISNLAGKYFAINNKCTHMNGDLSKGKLEGNIVTCPKHGSKFDVTTGKAISGPKIPLLKIKIKDEEKYELKIQGEDILIKL